MDPPTVFILTFVLLGLLTIGLIVLMIRTFDLLATMRGNCKNAFVPLSLQLVKRRQIIEKLISKLSNEPFANEKQGLLESMRRACNSATSAEQRANNSRSSGHFSTRLAPMEDAMIYSLCQLIECLHNCDHPQAKEWVNQLRQPLNETAERIESALNDFNRSLEDFNRARSSFPFVLVAGIMGFQRMRLIYLKKVNY